ncbi:ATPase [Microcystis phage Me-ZS1]|nr:ATPase [Microcystis phage Me-ZS1]
MPLRFSTTDRVAFAGVKVLVYGPAGVGKTCLAATAPAPFIISAESGLLSLRKVSVPYVEVTNVQELTEAYNWCVGSHEAKQFQTFCIDSISEIAEVVLSNAKKQVKDPRQAYGELIEKMMLTIRAFRDIQDRHVYMSAKMEPTKDELTGIVRYGPSMPGSKLGNQLPYLFDEVFRLFVNKTPQNQEYRALQTRPDLQFEAKDRSGSLDQLEPPDLNHIFAKIRG